MPAARRPYQRGGRLERQDDLRRLASEAVQHPAAVALDVDASREQLLLVRGEEPALALLQLGLDLLARAAVSARQDAQPSLQIMRAS